MKVGFSVNLFAVICILLSGLILTGSLFAVEPTAKDPKEEQEKRDRVEIEKLNVLGDLANTYNETGKYDEAINSEKKIIDYVLPADSGEDLKNVHLRKIFDSHYDMGWIYYDKKKEFPQALECFQSALGKVDVLKFDALEAKEKKLDLLKTIANLYKEMKQPEKAIEILKTAEEIK